MWRMSKVVNEAVYVVQGVKKLVGESGDRDESI
jgi:hypothetical protein